MPIRTKIILRYGVQPFNLMSLSLFYFGGNYMKIINKYIALLGLFFFCVPFIRIFFYPFTTPTINSIQLIPFTLLNKYTIRIYFLNFCLYLFPGYLYFKSTQAFHNTLKNKLRHFFVFFLICFFTKILYFIFKIGVFDMSTVIIQNIAILFGYIIAHIVTHSISKLCSKECCNK